MIHLLIKIGDQIIQRDIYIYEIIDQSQDLASPLEANRNILNVNNNKERNIRHEKVSISERKQANTSSNTGIKNIKNVQECVKQITRTSPIKRKHINYKESNSYSPSKKANISTRSSPIKRKPVNYKEFYSRSPLKKQKKNKQCYIPKSRMDLFNKTDNQFGNQVRENEIPHIRDTFSDTENLIFIRQQKHMALSEGSNFNDLKDNPFLEQGNKVHEELQDIKLSPTCIVCKERWYDMQISKIKKMCQRCLADSRKVIPVKKDDKDKVGTKILTYSFENDMHPDPVPECIKRLSFIELAAIKLVQPMYHIV